MQEQRDALVGLAAQQYVHVVAVAIQALPDDPQQLLLEDRQLCRDVGQLLERHVADIGGGQRDRLAAVSSIAHGIEADQLAWQMEAQNLLLAVLADRHRLEGAVTGHEHRRQRVAGAKQPLAPFDRATPTNDVVEANQIVGADAGGQAQLLQGALGAALSQARQIKISRKNHGAYHGMESGPDGNTPG